MPLVSLSPDAVQHFTDNNGNPLSGGLLFTYAAGTMTKLATYTDATGATPNTNPIILNSRGEAGVWLQQGTPYKFILSPAGDTDPPSNPIWTVDSILTSPGQLAASTSVTVPGQGTLALTAAQLNYSLIKLQGTLTGALTVTIPSGTSGEWTFFNQTSGGFAITVQTTAAAVSGTSSGGNIASTLNDTTKSWTTNQFSSGSVTITAGTGNGQTRAVLTNSATQLVVQPWSTTPDATSAYTVGFSSVTIPQGQPQTLASDGSGIYAVSYVPNNWKTANAQFYLPAAAGLGTTAVVTGTITNNDTVALTATGSFAGSPVTVTYTVHTADNLSTIAAGLAALVNASATLSTAGIRASSSGATAYLFSPTSTSNVWTRTNGGTETITLTTDAAETLTVTGTPNVGSAISVTFTSSGITGSPLTISYTALSTDTLTSCATALAAAINGNINLTGVGVIAFSSGAVVTVWLPTSLSCTFSTVSSATDAVILTSSTFAVGSLTAGVVAEFLATNTNTTTTPTANLDGLGAKTIQKAGSACFPSDITAGQTYRLQYDGTNWQLFSAVGRLINDQASPGNSQYYGTSGTGIKGWSALPVVPGGATVTNPMSSNLVLTRNSTLQQTVNPNAGGLAIQMPDATTMAKLGLVFFFINTGFFPVQIIDSGSNLIGYLRPGQRFPVLLETQSDSNGQWRFASGDPSVDNGLNWTGVSAYDAPSSTTQNVFSIQLQAGYGLRFWYNGTDYKVVGYNNTEGSTVIGSSASVIAAANLAGVAAGKTVMAGCAMTTTEALIIYTTGSNTFVQTIDLNTSTLAVTVNATATVVAATGKGLSCGKVPGAANAVITWDDGTTNFKTAIVSVSGGACTVNSAANIVATGINGATVVCLSSVLAHAYYTGGKVVRLVLSGTSAPTVGTPVSVTESQSNTFPALISTSATTSMAVVYAATGTTVINALLFTDTGSTITVTDTAMTVDVAGLNSGSWSTVGAIASASGAFLVVFANALGLLNFAVVRPAIPTMSGVIQPPACFASGGRSQATINFLPLGVVTFNGIGVLFLPQWIANSTTTTVLNIVGQQFLLA